MRAPKRSRPYKICERPVSRAASPSPRPIQAKTPVIRSVVAVTLQGMPMTTSHRPWLGFALEEALKQGITDADELLRHANPEVLVAQLPRELTTQIIARALGSG